MESILSNILNEYNNLLRSYESIYERFKVIDSKSMDEYINTIDNSSEYLESISGIQIKIQDLRNKLKSHINSDILIDSVIDGYSEGRIGYINDRISYIVNYLRTFEKKGKVVLEEEMEKVHKDLGIDAKLIEQGIKQYIKADINNQGSHFDRRQ